MHLNTRIARKIVHIRNENTQCRQSNHVIYFVACSLTACKLHCLSLMFWKFAVLYFVPCMKRDRPANIPYELKCICNHFNLEFLSVRLLTTENAIQAVHMARHAVILL